MASHSPSGPNMPSASWRGLTSSRLASFKDHVAQMDYRAWSSRVRGASTESSSRQAWTRQAPGSPYTTAQRAALGVEKVQLFPGWAVRRPAATAPAATDDIAEFDLDVYVSGFASSLRPPEAATRSQKAFYRLAKGYAALPKLPAALTSHRTSPQQQGPAGVQRSDTPSRPELKKSLSSGDNIEQLELETLEAQFRELSTSPSADDDIDSEQDTLSHHQREVPHRSTSTPYDTSHHTFPRSEPSTPISPATQRPFTLPSRLPELAHHALARLHANLDSRVQPFWASAIPNRTIRVSVYCPYPGLTPDPSEVHGTSEEHDQEIEPLATTYVTTSAEGSFETLLSVPWSRLATHPPTLHLAFGEHDVEYPVIVQAEMWAPPARSSSSALAASVPYLPYSRHSLHVPPSPPSAPPSPSPSSSRLASLARGASPARSSICMALPRAHVPVRLISDIDDTVKHAGVLQGTRHVFQNVFVRHLDELVLHSMVDWYRDLWQKGVRFHYVSNSPFQLLPVLTEYFHISSLPEGSIRLRSYAARSLLQSLLSPPASRKRQGVVDVLDAFPEARFMLVGDTGEQDMELYAELARERPRQVVGVFVRNVSTRDVAAVWEGGAGGGAWAYGGAGAGAGGAEERSHFGLPLVNKEPEPIPAMSFMGSLNAASPSSSSSLSSNSHSASSSTASSSSHSYAPPPPAARMLPLPRSRSLGSGGGGVTTPEERRQYDLESRVARARAVIPRGTAFRVFREPGECAGEVRRILERFGG